MRARPGLLAVPALALTANVDVRFVALVVAAAAMEAARPRRGWPVLAVARLRQAARRPARPAPHPLLAGPLIRRQRASLASVRISLRIRSRRGSDARSTCVIAAATAG